MSRSSSLAVSVPIIQQEASRQSTIARQQQQKEVQPQPPQGQLTSSSLPPEDNAQLKTISAGVDTQRKFETESERSATKKKKKILPHTYVHFIAGAAGGAVGSFLTMPFEVVRTRLQARYNKQQITGQEGLLRGTFSAMRRIYDLEGLRGLWRGLGPALTGVIPSSETLMKKVMIVNYGGPIFHIFYDEATVRAKTWGWHCVASYRWQCCWMYICHCYVSSLARKDSSTTTNKRNGSAGLGL